MDERLTDVGIDMAGEASEPGFDRIDGLADAGEAEPVDDPLDDADLIFGRAAIDVGHGDGRGQIAEGDMVAAKRLQGEVRIDHLIVGVGVGQRDRLVGHHLAHQLRDRLALVEPLAPDLGQRLVRLGLVETDEAGRPTIGEVLMIERVEQAGTGRVGKAQDRDGPQMLVAQHRLDAARQRGVDEKTVQMHRCRRCGDRMPPRRDRRVEK
ncbi:hypothetical protein D3C73_818080 [compost metagenome]